MYIIFPKRKKHKLKPPLSKCNIQHDHQDFNRKYSYLQKQKSQHLSGKKRFLLPPKSDDYQLGVRVNGILPPFGYPRSPKDGNRWHRWNYQVTAIYDVKLLCWNNKGAFWHQNQLGSKSCKYVHLFTNPKWYSINDRLCQ